jgi:parvulin-like peptidyl-prolyl isomerase
VKRLTALTAAAALVLAACGTSPGTTAATVDDQAITVGAVNGLIHVEEGTISKEVFANFLGLLIEWSVVERAAADELGITVSDEEILTEVNRIFEEFADEGQSLEEFVNSRGVTEEFLRMVSHQEVLYRKVSEKFKDEGRGVPDDLEASEEFDFMRIQLTDACASHILLGQLQTLEGDELEEARQEALAEAEEILDLLAGGGDFAELAIEHSVDTGSGALGGDLGCSTPARYVEPFRDAVMVATVGEVHPEPVLSTFGYHIILVESRTFPSDEEVVDGLVREEIDSWVGSKMEAAQVTVVERFGSWNPLRLLVEPPAA